MLGSTDSENMSRLLSRLFCQKIIVKIGKIGWGEVNVAYGLNFH